MEPYDTIDWSSARKRVAQTDSLVPRSFSLNAAYVLARWTTESSLFPSLARRALREAYDQIRMEDENTDYYDLISLSNVLNMVCSAHVEGNESDAVQKHLTSLNEFLWMGPDGMEMTATNGTQVWDTVFVANALIESGMADLPENRESVVRILDFLDKEQMCEDTRHYPKDNRQPTNGGW
jgi:lanosterol synthase